MGIYLIFIVLGAIVFIALGKTIIDRIMDVIHSLLRQSIFETTHSKDVESTVKNMLEKAGIDTDQLASEIETTKVTTVINGKTITKTVVRNKKDSYGSPFKTLGEREDDREFCEKAERDIIEYLHCIKNSDVSGIEDKCTKEFISNCIENINESENKGIRKVIDNFEITNSYIETRSSFGKNNVISVKVCGKANDFEIDIKTGRILTGNKEIFIPIEYEIVYKQRVGNGGNTSNVCEQCGAPVDVGDSRCGYCGVSIKGADGDTLISNIKQQYIM